MDAGSTPLIHALFTQVVDMTTEQRKQFLDQACAGAAEIRAGVESLLAALEQAGHFLADPTVPTAEVLPPVFPAIGSRIGPYTLRRILGEGGSGLVFLAEQDLPLRRNVALKVIKAGMDTREVIARFEAERQALAMMDHPNIAKVFDAGTSEDGRPYFAMELVGGRPVTEFCERHRLPVRARVNLFIGVCKAVQHAHQKGIIHRDLKPSNVLVAVHDRRPVPKVIDFGIAKALDAPVTGRTVVTMAWQFMGTPQYMSPEQVMMSPAVDARADIYALGATLYELLAGAAPFEPASIQSKPLAEVQRVVREVAPVPPSRRAEAMATHAANVNPEEKRQRLIAAGELRGGLDAIVLHAMAKDPADRYPSAEALAEDLRRFLDDEPLSVAPARRFPHLLGRFGQRSVIVAGIGLLLALTGLSVFLPNRPHARRPVEKMSPIPLSPQPASAHPGPAVTLPPPASPREALLRTSVLYFNFDRSFSSRQGDKLLLKDLSARQTTAVITGARFVPGVMGEALQFGADDRLDCTANVGIAGNAPRSISFFLSPTVVPKGRWHAILGWGAGTLGRNFWVKIFRSHYQLWSSGKDNDWNVPLDVEEKTWHHHAITFDGSVARWYLDGKEVGDGFPHTYNTVDTPLEIGGGEFSIDELAIFDRALTLWEIHLLSSIGAGPTTR